MATNRILTRASMVFFCLTLIHVAKSQDYWIYTHGPGTGYDVRSLTVNSMGHVYAGTWTDGSIWKTADNGQSWSKCAGYPNQNPVLGMTTNSRDQVFASVYLRGVYRSTDHGASWQLKNNGLENLAVRVISLDKGGSLWVGSEQGLFRSTDDGETWTRKLTGFFGGALQDSTGAIVTYDVTNFKEYRSTDSGDNWSMLPQPSGVLIAGVHPDGSYFAWASPLTVLRSTDFGATWADLRIPAGVSGSASCMTFNRRGDVFGAVDGEAGGILTSTDKGGTWQVKNSGLTTRLTMPLLYHPNGHMFVGTGGAGVFRTSVVTEPTSVTARPFTADSTTRALWHFDESSGTTVYDYAGNNHGTAVGTTIVRGPFGNARLLNGSGDYILVPSSAALDFGTASFRVDIWFKTTVTQAMIIRRGLAPDPGFLLKMNLGHVVALIGNREDSVWPDTLLSVQSDSAFNDDQWHLATLVRDRSTETLSLYVDDSIAAAPIHDPITFPISGTHPLTIGRWEHWAYPDYLAGSVDEVRISCSAPLYSRVKIDAQPETVSFGKVLSGTSDTVSIQIMNAGNRDSLKLQSLTSTDTHFRATVGTLTIPPLGTARLTVMYAPILAGRDTGAILVTSNDPATPVFRLPVSGESVVMTDEPIIAEIVSVDYSQARIVWFRSILDAPSSPDPVTEYSLWRRLSGSRAAGGAGATLASSSGWIFEFLLTVPAMGFERYAARVSQTWDGPWNVYMVAAHTEGRRVYSSSPDSVRVYSATGISASPEVPVPNEVALSQNYPNPFNPTTTIRYGLPHKSAVQLSVFNTLGQQVATLVEGEREAGYHEVRFNAAGLSSGVYFYRLQAGNFVQTRKLLLLH